ncbi:MAG: hypothetical protein WAN93_10680 [Solirubrobacteraceae bacterium]
MTSDSPDNFRARRQKLPPEAFAIHPDSEPEAVDLIDQYTWNGIVNLPDDVALRTSERHGEVLHHAYAAWGYWLGMVLDIQALCDPNDDPLAVAVLNATDEFQASAYAALTGFYRQSIGTLRPALEAMLAAVYFKVLPNKRSFTNWQHGNQAGRLWIKTVRRKLAQCDPFPRFEESGDELLADGGWVVWLYGILSEFLHGRPAHTDDAGKRIETTNGGMWNSNGPIYAEDAFVLWSRLYFNTLLLAVLLAGLADPRLVRVTKPNDITYEQYVEKLIDWHPTPGAPLTAATIAEYLMSPR